MHNATIKNGLFCLSLRTGDKLFVDKDKYNKAVQNNEGLIVIVNPYLDSFNEMKGSSYCAVDTDNINFL